MVSSSPSPPWNITLFIVNLANRTTAASKLIRGPWAHSHALSWGHTAAWETGDGIGQVTQSRVKNSQEPPAEPQFLHLANHSRHSHRILQPLLLGGGCGPAGWMQCSDLLLALCSRISPGRVWGNLWGARDRTWAGHMQSRCPPHCTITNRTHSLESHWSCP